MRYICEGMEYTFTPSTGVLLDNYGTHVATLDKSFCDEYLYACDSETDESFDSTHENNVADSDHARGQWLVERYTVREIN